MLSASELIAARAEVALTLSETAVIQRPAWVSDGQGGGTTSWQAAGTANCRIAPNGTGAEREIAAKLQAISPWFVTLPAETDVKVTDRIQIGSRTLEVGAILAPRTLEVCRRVVCMEVL
jgi:head-tail adaptor